MRKSILGVFVLAMTVLFSSAAFAQPYDGVDGTLDVADTTLAPGADVPIQGAGYAANSEITISIESTPRTLDRVRAGTDGAFSLAVTIPTDIPAGEHTLKATGVTQDGATRVLAMPITVAGSTTAAGELAFTGGRTIAALTVGLTLLALGGAVLFVTRRRMA